MLQNSNSPRNVFDWLFCLYEVPRSRLGSETRTKPKVRLTIQRTVMCLCCRRVVGHSTTASSPQRSSRVVFLTVGNYTTTTVRLYVNVQFQDTHGCCTNLLKPKNIINSKLFICPSAVKWVVSLLHMVTSPLKESPRFLVHVVCNAFFNIHSCKTSELWQSPFAFSF